MLWSRCGDVPGMPSFAFSFNVPPGLVRVVSGIGQAHSSRHGHAARSNTQPAGRGHHPPRLQDRRLGLDRSGQSAAFSTPTSRWSSSRPKRWTACSMPGDRRRRPGPRPAHEEVRGAVHPPGECSTPRRAKTKRPRPIATTYQRYLVLRRLRRLRRPAPEPAALAVRVDGKGIGEACELELTELDAWLAAQEGPVAEPLVRKMRAILATMITIGRGVPISAPRRSHALRRREPAGQDGRASSTATSRA